MAGKKQGPLELPENAGVAGPQESRFEYIRAFVEDVQSLRWEYKLKDGTSNRMTCDESVFKFSDEEVRKLTRRMLDAADDEPVEVIRL